jgi:hypothetical protein
MQHPKRRPQPARQQRRHTPPPQKVPGYPREDGGGPGSLPLSTEDRKLARQAVKMCNVMWTHHGKPNGIEAQSKDLFAAVNALLDARSTMPKAPQRG